MKPKLLIVSFLVLVCAITASAQRSFVPLTTTVTIDNQTVTKNFQLSGGALLSGTIDAGSAHPSQVMLVSQTNPQLSFKTTKIGTTASGIYRYAVVAPNDSYDVIVTYGLSQSSGPGISSSLTLTYQESTIALTADTKHNITITPLPLNLVSGSVSGVSSGFSDYFLKLDSTTIPGFSEVRGSVTVVRNGSTGTYSIPLPSGTFTWSLEQDFIQAGFASEFLGLHSVTSGGNVINLSATPVTLVTLSGNISFMNTPIPNAVLTAATASANSPVVVTGDSVDTPRGGSNPGNFSIKVPAGEAYTLTATVGFYQTPPFQTSIITSDTVVNPVYPAIPSLGALSTLQGTVTGPAGTPLGNCEIDVVSITVAGVQSTLWRTSVFSGGDGQYSAPIPAGSYNVFVTCSFSAAGDLDGDGKSEMTVFRPSDGTWYSMLTDPGVQVQQWGTNGDIPVRGDFDGDGITDIAVFRPSTGQWFVVPSSNPTTTMALSWGITGDIPVPGFYYNCEFGVVSPCGTAFAVFRPSTGEWFVAPNSLGQGPIVQPWGTAGDIPVPADYDGDGLTDFAVFRPSTGQWFILPSSNPGGLMILRWGTTGDDPVPGDYDGDGKADIAVFRPSTGTWFILPSGTGGPITEQWGTSGDIPVPADYDADQITDIAVWRPSNGTWYVLPSGSPGASTITPWGTSGDVPLERPIGQ